MTVTYPIISGGEYSTKTFKVSGDETLTLYGVRSEKIIKTAGQIEMPMPNLDSNSKIIMDLMGASREITVVGEVSKDDLGGSEIYEYAEDLVGLGNDTLVFGNQEDQYNGDYLYKSEMLNRGYGGSDFTVAVVIKDVTTESVEGNPNSLRYSIMMVEHKQSPVSPV